MSFSEPGRTATEQRSRQAMTSRRRTRDWRETRPWYQTTEFWAMVVGVVAIVVIYNAAADASFNLWRAMLLGTAIAIGYIVSRGFAKAGSHDDHWSNDDWDDGRYNADLRNR